MRPKLLITGAAVVLLGGTVAGLALAWGSAAKQPLANPALPPATAKVTKTTLVETKKVSGTLGHGDAVPVSAAQTGTLTWVAPEGSTVKRGQPLFKLDERPVVELYGSLPLYRPLRAGVKGADVKQFEENLWKLGYTGFTVDDTYTAATAQAARRWQADLGLPETGTVEPGQAVFTPGAIRIAEHTARVGDRIGDRIGGDTGGGTGGGASVLSYTGTTRLVTVELAVADLALAAKGRTVTVTVPGHGPVKGTIAQVGTVATAPEQTTNAPGDQASTAPGGSSSTAADARIQVTVTIADQNKLGWLDGAPVGVDFVSQQRQGVLAVPVAALLALPNGGYGVQVVQGGATRIVAVKTGMFAAGRVEISGDGIAEGVTVGVPK
jgi:Putative peptidoglycan binding domain